MCALLLLVGIALVGQASAVESTHIDGILVYGKLHDVSIGDMHEAVATATRDMNGKPAALEVVDRGEMRAYLPLRDMGWLTESRVIVHEADGRVHPGWYLHGLGIRDSPDALRFIRTADEIYVFPITTPRKPHRDDKHLRLLDQEASARLVRLLGDQQDWFLGLDDRIWGDGVPTSLGFLFRKGATELVLFFPFGGQAVGTLDGQHTSGSLEDKLEQKLETWKRQYARSELAETNRTWLQD
jgi:hypothetical protein